MLSNAARVRDQCLHLGSPRRGFRIAAAVCHRNPDAATERPRPPRPRRGLASVHADEGSRVAADDPDPARRGRLAVRRRWTPLPGRDQLLVGEPVRARQPADRGGGHRAARTARARHAGRLHARPGGRTRGAAHGARATRPDALLLRGQRLERDRGRAQDELPLLAQRGPAGQAPLRDADQQLPRRNAGRAGGRPRRPVPGDLPAAADGRDLGPLPRLLRA